ncbi:MAG: hypothetical protein AAF942_16535 [Pseudomonadota bacterium]
MPTPNSAESATNGGARTIEAASISLETLTADELRQMERAGHLAIECEDALAATDHNVVSEVLEHQGDFVEWRHYPKGDVFDTKSHSQFYYHAHPPDERVDGEHGHFHTFVHGAGIAKRHKPIPLSEATSSGKRPKRLCHVIGISMDVYGQAFRLFTTNRWVTGETWFAAEDAVPIAEGFEIAHTKPSWPANRWITAMVATYRPHIAALIGVRDEVVARWSKRHPQQNVYEDKRLNVISQMWISLDQHVDAVEAALADKRPA